jgi:SIR2-like domain
MSKKRIVFLFGAGATLDWGSPLTSELTALILQSGFKITGNKKTITQFIYDTLLANGFKKADVTFETIINVIEELIVYYGSFNYGEYFESNKLPSLVSCFFKPLFEKKLLNFSIEGGEVKHGYKLQIPAGVTYHQAHNSYHNEPPAQFFFQHLLNELLTAISLRITHYSQHSATLSAIAHESEMSKLLVKWMQKLQGGNTLRLYTLNYERIFKILLEKSGIPVFEGFDCDECVSYTARLRANVKRILSDYECHTHYNLYGSAFWEVLELDKEQLPNPELVLTVGMNLPINNSPATFQMEKGKTLMVTNIVTGYQKAQKAMITPFKQMQAAFDRDCCFADDIYIIGYSLGDEHINESIKTAIRHNPNVKIYIVDPYFSKNDKDQDIALRFFPFRPAGNLAPTNVSDNILSYLDGSLIVYTLGFMDFLKLETDPATRFQYRISQLSNGRIALKP